MEWGTMFSSNHLYSSFGSSGSIQSTEWRCDFSITWHQCRCFCPAKSWFIESRGKTPHPTQFMYTSWTQKSIITYSANHPSHFVNMTSGHMIVIHELFIYVGKIVWLQWNHSPMIPVTVYTQTASELSAEAPWWCAEDRGSARRRFAHGPGSRWSRSDGSWREPYIMLAAGV